MISLPRKPITFAEYMERCLYDPDHGYYTSGRQVFGPTGDFYTSAHTHPLFAEILTDAFVDLLRNLGSGPFQLVELGPGDRSLARSIRSYLERTHPSVAVNLEYRPVDVREALPEQIRGIVFSNELFDALPVHRVRVRNRRLRELYVQGDETGRICETEGPVSDDRIPAYLKVGFGRRHEGWEYEVNLRMVECLEALNRRIRQAYVFTIDYGFLREEYGRVDRAGVVAPGRVGRQARAAARSGLSRSPPATGSDGGRDRPVEGQLSGTRLRLRRSAIGAYVRR